MEKSECKISLTRHALRRESYTPQDNAQWPYKLSLVPCGAPYFDGAELLIAADCTAYSCKNFSDAFKKDAVTLILCPRSSECDYTARLKQIISDNDIKGATLVRMEADCCHRTEEIFKTALKDSGKFIPWQIVTISTDGKILN